MVRIGQGFDVHRLTADRPLVLGGVPIPSDRGLAGHSDADVLLHAITDAVLGALAAGDIGQWFPPDDDRWRNADSAVLLQTVLHSAPVRNWALGNLDCTVVAEAPKLAPHIPKMRQTIAALFGAAAAQVSVKATTSERLGFTGRGEGIAAIAVVVMLPRAGSSDA